MVEQPSAEDFQDQTEELFENLFIDVIDATLLTQARLDSTRRTEPPVTYSIPRVTADVEFQLETKTRGRIALFFSGKKRVDLHHHKLKFVLNSSPSPPEIPEIPPSGQAPPLQLIEPPFIVGQSGGAESRGLSEDDLRQLLIEVFRRPDDRVKVALPGNQDNHKKKLSGEANKMEEVHAEPSSDRGILYFELPTSPPSYLVVRLAGKSAKDGLYIVSPEQRPSVEVFSYIGDGEKDIAYPPLHQLVLAIRGWLRGAATTTRPAPKGFGQSFGIGSLHAFVRFLYEDYFHGLQSLAAQPVVGRFPYPTYYDLTEMEAELSYTVPSGDSASSELEIGARTSASDSPDSQAYQFIESRALVRIERSKQQAIMKLELLAPEFVLVGQKRDTFVEWAENSAMEIAGRLAKHEAKTTGSKEPQPVAKYEAFLHDPDAQEGVVVLLAYKGKRPSNQFLVIWPESGEDNARDFVFSCELDVKRERLKVTNVVMCVEDRLDQAESLGAEPDAETEAETGAESGAESDAQPDAEENDLTGKEYKAFHKFFRAVNAWRIRSR